MSCGENLIISLALVGFMHILKTDTTNSRLQEVFAWKELDFQFPNDERRTMAIDTEQFIPGNAVITGIEIYMDRLYLSVPRLKAGVPSTLNYVLLKEIQDDIKSPILIPYPSLQDNLQEPQTSQAPQLVSISRIKVDPCNRLWAIDNGIKDTYTSSPKTEMPPTIHVFDLRMDQLWFSYSLKESVDYKEDESLFPNIVVDVTSGNCDDAFVYLPDVGSPAIVVYNLKTNETHRLKHNYFHFDPMAGDFYLSNKKHFQSQAGIYSLALSPIDKDNYRTVYFHPLASTKEFTVSTRILQNSTLSDDYLNAFRIIGDRGPNSQSTVSVLDEETGIIFYTQIVKNAIVCWNTYKGEDYKSNLLGLIADDAETMPFPNDIKVDNEGFIWILTDNIAEFEYSTSDSSIVHMRIYRAAVRDAIKGTVCD